MHCATVTTVYDQIDAAATINFSTQFGVATIREQRLFESSIYFAWRRYYGGVHYASIISIYVHTSIIAHNAQQTEHNNGISGAFYGKAVGGVNVHMYDESDH